MGGAVSYIAAIRKSSLKKPERHVELGETSRVLTLQWYFSLMHYCVYILSNPTRTVLYIGITNNLERRLYEHGQGLGDAGKFTGRYQCNLLVYFEASPDASQAIAREKQLKKWSHAKKESLIGKLNPTWEPLDLHTWGG